MAWDTPATLSDLQRDFLDKFGQDLSPTILLQTVEANRQWLSAELANEALRLLYFNSLGLGTSLKISDSKLDTKQNLSEDGSPTFQGIRIASLSGYLKATAGWVGVDVGGGTAAETYSYTFAYGDSTPQIVAAISASLVIQVTVRLSEIFDGVGAEFTVGDSGNHSRLLGAGDIDLTSLGLYLVSPGHLYAAPENLNIYITPGAGATSGAGTVIIYTI